MSTKYSINEVIRFAVEIEKEGQFFYCKLAEKASEQELKDLYLWLMEEEVAHQRLYEKYLQELGTENEFYFEDNDYNAYLRAYIENTVFDKANIEKIVASFSNDLSVSEYAIKKERDSISFYENLKKFVGEDKKEMIDKIINEEKMHIIKLIDFKEKIDA